MIIQVKFFFLAHKKISTIFSLTLLLISPVFSCFSQSVQLSKDEKADFALLEAVKIYDSHLRRNTMVYTGRSYHDDEPNVKGHPYFGEDYWEFGRIDYDNNVYDSIYLKYDIYKDHILIENFNSDGFLSPITLFRKKVASFDLMGHYFVRIENDTLSNLKAGFYDRMYKHNGIEVLVKRRKEIVNSNDYDPLGEMYNQNDRYYLKKDNYTYQVRKKKSILKVLSDYKKEIKMFIKSNNFSFKVNTDIQIVEVVKYYDSLGRN